MLGSTGRARARVLSAATAVAVAVAVVGFTAAPAGADGSETLGVPSIDIAQGSGFVAAGTGTRVQPATIDVEVPADTSVRQVLLYWEGQHGSTTDADANIAVNGTGVDGQLIGGPNFFFDSPLGAHYSSTYRADITSLGMVSAGPNQLTVTEMDFNRANGGAGVIVIYSDGTYADLGIRDGNDLAFRDFPDPRRTTVPQEFTFPAADEERTASMSLFASSVAGPDFAGFRPSVIYVSVGDTVIEFINVLGSGDGDEWDTFTTPITIPAGVTKVGVQIVSNDVLFTGLRPASLAWNAAALSVPGMTPPPPPGGGTQGCTPGYWRQPHHLGSWSGYAPADSYADVFGVPASFDLTLLEAVAQGGGGEAALGRHAVAALLNSSNTSVDYAFSADQVIALVQQAYANGTFDAVKNAFEAENEKGCPLGRAEADDASQPGPPADKGPKVVVKTKGQK